MSGTQQVNFRSGALRGRLLTRAALTGGGVAVVAKEDLTRYYLLIDKNPLTLSWEHAKVLAEAVTPWPNLEEANLEDVLAQLRALAPSRERDSLVEWVERLDDLERMVLLDGLERFWASKAEWARLPTGERFEAAGFLIR